MNSTREEWPRRSRLVAAFAPLGLGLIFLVMSLSRPTIANMSFHDLIRLLATGGVLGVGVAVLTQHFALRRKG
jgi:hypothetical protein